VRSPHTIAYRPPQQTSSQCRNGTAATPHSGYQKQRLFCSSSILLAPVNKCGTGHCLANHYPDPLGMAGARATRISKYGK
jgi:hypothetical protein